MFAWGTRTFVVGIVNCSPDSFAGDGHPTAAAAVEHRRQQWQQQWQQQQVHAGLCHCEAV